MTSRTMPIRSVPERWSEDHSTPARDSQAIVGTFGMLSPPWKKALEGAHMAKRKKQRALVEETIQAILDEQQQALEHGLENQDQQLADPRSSVASREADLKEWLNLDFDSAYEGLLEDLKKRMPLPPPSDEDWQAALARFRTASRSNANDTPA